MNLSFLPILKIILEGKASFRFLLAVIFSLAFSIAVILGTIGLMDGFEMTLKNHLRQSSGDIILNYDSGFFAKDELGESLNREQLRSAAILQIEGFSLANNKSKGVLIKGINAQSFNRVTPFNIKLKNGQIIIGKELAKELALKLGDSLYLSYMGKDHFSEESAIIREYIVGQIINHGIYEKDLRFVYLDINDLRNSLGLSHEDVNIVYVKGPMNWEQRDIENEVRYLRRELPHFNIAAYWDEFDTLIKAVEIQKVSISIVLQIIVVVAVFNLVAFMIYISERKSQEFFLLRAFGLSMQSIRSFWFKMSFIIWPVSSFLAVVMIMGLNLMLQYSGLIDLPGDIYVLGKLRIVLDIKDYLIVFFSSLIWILFIVSLALAKFKQQSILKGLRQEFS